MGYQVIYDGKKVQQGNGLHFRLVPMTVVALLLFLLVVNAHWPKGQEVLRELLLPEKVDTALTAFNALADDLLSGETFPEAWEVFCDEIVR